MSARKQAMEDALLNLGESAHFSDMRTAAEIGVEASSDVWEPLVRDLLEALLYVDERGAYYDDHWNKTWNAIDQAKKALR